MGCLTQCEAMIVGLVDTYRKRRYPELPLVGEVGWRWHGTASQRPDRVVHFTDRNDKALFVALQTVAAGGTVIELYDLGQPNSVRHGTQFADELSRGDGSLQQGRPSTDVNGAGTVEPLELVTPKVVDEYVGEILRSSGYPVTANNFDILDRQVSLSFLLKLHQFLDHSNPAAARRFIETHAFSGEGSPALGRMFEDAYDITWNLVAYSQDVPTRVRALLLTNVGQDGTFWDKFDR